MSDALLDLDDLLDAAVLEGALAAGRDPRLAARQFGTARVVAVGPGRPAVSRVASAWSAADDEALTRYAGVLTPEELGALLGRSAVAVETRTRIRGLPTPLTHPEFVSANGVAWALGVDVHAVVEWVERGLLRAECLAFGSGRKLWRVRRTALYAWATNPLNWVYFIRSVRRPERIHDEELRRLVERRKANWDDEWWSIGQVADYHGVVHQFVNKYIRAGRLPAVKWANWWVLRSEATRPGFRMWRMSDGQLPHRGTTGEDAFIVLASAVGIPGPHIARLMGGKRADSGVVTRYQAIVARGLVPWLAQAYSLPLEIRRQSVWCDWRKVAHRFPALRRAWARLDEAGKLNRHDRALLSGVMAAFLRFHGLERSEWSLGHGDATAENLRAAQTLYEEYL